MSNTTGGGPASCAGTPRSGLRCGGRRGSGRGRGLARRFGRSRRQRQPVGQRPAAPAAAAGCCSSCFPRCLPRSVRWSLASAADGVSAACSACGEPSCFLALAASAPSAAACRPSWLPAHCRPRPDRPPSRRSSPDRWCSAGAGNPRPDRSWRVPAGSCGRPSRSRRRSWARPSGRRAASAPAASLRRSRPPRPPQSRTIRPEAGHLKPPHRRRPPRQRRPELRLAHSSRPKWEHQIAALSPAPYRIADRGKLCSNGGVTVLPCPTGCRRSVGLSVAAQFQSLCRGRQARRIVWGGRWIACCKSSCGRTSGAERCE